METVNANTFVSSDRHVVYQKGDKIWTKDFITGALNVAHDMPYNEHLTSSDPDYQCDFTMSPSGRTFEIHHITYGPCSSMSIMCDGPNSGRSTNYKLVPFRDDVPVVTESTRSTYGIYGRNKSYVLVNDLSSYGFSTNATGVFSTIYFGTDYADRGDYCTIRGTVNRIDDSYRHEYNVTPECRSATNCSLVATTISRDGSGPKYVIMYRVGRDLKDFTTTHDFTWPVGRPFDAATTIHLAYPLDGTRVMVVLNDRMAIYSESKADNVYEHPAHIADKIDQTCCSYVNSDKIIVTVRCGTDVWSRTIDWRRPHKTSGWKLICEHVLGITQIAKSKRIVCLSHEGLFYKVTT